MGEIIQGEETASGSRRILLEHNVFIVWKPEYNLGIPIIDEQHRGIVTTINSLHFGMQNNYIRDFLIPIIDMMHDYTRIHFQIEEHFLEAIDFPNATLHHELHLDLSSKLSSTGWRSMLDKDPYQFMDFLKNWWIDHICSEDLIFRNFLISSSEVL
ncbi:MAG: hemerythrin family protein [Oscillospiraceae bacterium]|jgi:hemerythrin|nr:hemerythrin family protein [Oscillospiraceae bacterium]